MKNICILGSTGSIGTQALQVVDSLRDELNVVGLAARGNVDLIEDQIRKYAPQMAALADEKSADVLSGRVSDTDVEVLGGQDGIIQLATMPADMVLSAIVGIAGLLPTLKAIESGRDVALANKESLVTAGPIVMKAADENGVSIIPVDGEHSAIFQCLAADSRCENLSRLILTASGGPFRNASMDELQNVTPEQALKHPNWDMGRRITIDSATLMNKGFEVIEARWLFDVDTSKVDVVIHPQSIVHSMVEFIDGSILAHLSTADMRLQIQHALMYPERRRSPVSYLDLAEVECLNFQRADMERFPCLKYAYEACEIGGTMPAVVNGADEMAVAAFLNRKIGFMDIPRTIKKAIDAHQPVLDPSLDDIIAADIWVRQFAQSII